MNLNLRHRIKRILRNAPGLFKGYNIYVDPDKLNLIEHVFRHLRPEARSFADLGGVWNVHGAYTRHALLQPSLQRGILVDTDFPEGLRERLERLPRLTVVKGDFTSPDIVTQIGPVDAVFFFDVLLHQANPSWEDVLSMYAAVTPCFVIFNQQYVHGASTLRLTSLPIEEYIAIAPKGRDEVYRHVYAHADEIHPQYGKPWRDMHNIFQWGITDGDLRRRMNDLGYREVYYRNHGHFSNLPAFENHAFVFIREK